MSPSKSLLSTVLHSASYTVEFTVVYNYTAVQRAHSVYLNCSRLCSAQYRGLGQLPGSLGHQFLESLHLQLQPGPSSLLLLQLPPQASQLEGNNVQCTLNSAQYTVLCAHYTLHRTVITTVSSVHYTMHTTQCTVREAFQKKTR